MEVRKEQLEVIEHWADVAANRLGQQCPGQESRLGSDYRNWVFAAGCEAALQSGLELADFPEPDSFSHWVSRVVANAAKDVRGVIGRRSFLELEYTKCSFAAADSDEFYRVYCRQLEARSDIARLRKVMSADALEALSVFLEYGELLPAAREMQIRRGDVGKYLRGEEYYAAKIQRALDWARRLLSE